MTQPHTQLMPRFQENKLSKELTKNYQGIGAYAFVSVALLVLAGAFATRQQMLFAGYTIIVFLIQTLWLFELKDKNITVKKMMMLDVIVHVMSWFPVWMLFLISIHITRFDTLPLNSYIVHLVATIILGVLCLSAITYHVWYLVNFKKQEVITYNVFKPAVNFAYIFVLGILLYLLVNVPRLLGVI